jgi:L-alanine-DL-glutamate epimerase-like enolase superfamily enzyme
LWDIAGKSLGVPVYQLLGGLAHEKLLIYASAGMDKPKEALIEELDEYKRRGFRAVKIRIGHTPDRDRDKVRLAREVLGDQIEVMVDAVQGHNPEPWTSAEAIVVARALEEFRPAWFEEPCGNTDYRGYRRVRQATTIPVAGGESSTTIHEFERFFERHALEVVQPDVTHAGGILECKKIAALAEADSVRLAPHSWGSGAVLAANYHFGFSTPNCWMLEYPTWGFPLRDELLLEPLVIEDGYLYPPTAPGLGIALRQETIDKYPYRPGRWIEMKNTTRG